jgi:predicted ATPase/transcriptional regulator with XRE-family HTH domain
MGDVPSFGAWLKRRRKALDLTQDSLAQRVGCAVVTIRKLESDMQPPSRQLAERLAEHLAIPTEQRETFIRFARQGLDAAPPELPLPTQARVPEPPSASSPPPSLSRERNNLPAQLTPLIGREREVGEVCALLRWPEVRLVTLTGPGGIGKTRLALQAAAELLDDFADGASFVSLAPIAEVAFMVPAIAEALGFVFSGQTTPKDQLLDYLSQKQLLLVLDNFEHLLDGAELLSDIVRQAPGVVVLATSRERLQLHEEWLYEVQGLSYPTGTDTTAATAKIPEAFSTYAAVQLFVQRARQTQAGFAPSTDELAEIGRICQQVAGMPLGLELAAPWVRTLSCREIAAEIAHSLDFLTTTLRNVPQRQRSLRAVYQQTWQRLSQAEQAVLMQLSIFRGGCTREAAETVAGARLPVLSSLMDKALIRRTKSGRYELHELIRQFAQAQLQTDPEAFDQTQQRYQEYFITFLETRAAGVKGVRQKATLVEIKADMGNVRLVWRRAVTERQVQALERATECLFIFYLYSSGYYEGQTAFDLAVAAFGGGVETQTDDSPPNTLAGLHEQANLVGFLFAVQAFFLAGTSGRHVLSEATIIRLLEAPPGNRRREAIALACLSWALIYQGRFAEARLLAERSLARASETGEALAEAWSLLALGSPGVHGRPAEAEQFLKRLLIVCTASGDSSTRGYACHNLAWVAVELGRYDEASEYVEQTIRIFEELGSLQGLGYAYDRAGKLAIARGDYQQAIRHYQTAIAYYTETRSSLHTNYGRIWFALAFRLQGEYEQAKQIYRQTLAAFTTIDDQLHAAYCLLGLGCLAHEQGEMEQAEHLQREALEIWQHMGQEARVADASRCLGHLLLAAGEQRHAEARHAFQQALELSAKHQMAPIVLDVCVGVARLQAKAGKTEQAVELVSLAKEHDASTFETRKQAGQLVSELVNSEQPEQARAAQTQGQSRELWEHVPVLLAELAAEQA